MAVSLPRASVIRALKTEISAWLPISSDQWVTDAERTLFGMEQVNRPSPLLSAAYSKAEKYDRSSVKDA